uniref:Glycosyltransferase family 2 protein n=1 Tax=Archaeoglobus fulgidus TaxID=2234 RepID=A0A7J2THW9_ARCFL
MKLSIVVPVSPFETEKALKDSLEHVKNLKKHFNCRAVYVIDRNSEKDERARIAREMGFEVIERNGRRGKRAGAINDAVEYLKTDPPQFVLILDIDSRTDVGTISNCISALLKDDRAYIASAKRLILNSFNLVSETVEAEYRLINFLLKRSSFKQFNGLIGVLRYDLLCEKLNEDAMAEDADFATRMYARGFKALMVDGVFYEQAPLSWKDFYRQRKRWYYGGLQLWKYRREMMKNREARLSWILALTITYFPILLIPFLPIAFFLLLYYKKRPKIVIGLLIYSIVLQFSAISAFLDFLRKKEVEWNAIRRI